jgi:asparagine synthase (glutamine-hydrolysing)
MCGITGEIFLDKERQIDPYVLEKMSDSIYHRGPDDKGIYIKKNVGLGFRRLSIIDLNTGHQPLSNKDNSIIIVFNGEIYNYLEQGELLKKKGYQFKTTTDTEVILYLYEEYGTDCLQYLRGMFAFAIWDDKKQQLFCARDRFGIKPFYYYFDNEKFLFGSEIKAIMAEGNIDRTISSEALDFYFAIGYVTGDLSIYRNIKKLRPAHFFLLSFKNNKASLVINKYWDINFDPDYSKSEKQWIEEIDACLTETVKLHMISDVPLGAFLSGGIDSSSVVAMMAKNSSLPVRTFSIGFREEIYSELKYSREIAEYYNCEFHEQIVEPESISLLPELVRAYDEPFADPSAIPTYYVSKLARKYVTVALSGDGGDELFAGYDIYNFFNRIHSFPLNFESFRLNKIIWGSIYKTIPIPSLLKNTSYYLSRNKNYVNAYSYVWSIEERQKLILDSFHVNEQGKSAESYEEGILRESNSKDFVSNMQLLDLKTYLVDDILKKVDRSSMMNSLEARVPLLDHKFAELSFRIPSNLKLKKKEKKYIFRQAMSGYLPNNILSHKKQGFNVPISVWFKGDLKEFTKDTLLSQNPLYSDYLDKKFVTKVLKDNITKTKDRSSRIWSLLFFEEWLKQCVI